MSSIKDALETSEDQRPTLDSGLVGDELLRGESN